MLCFSFFGDSFSRVQIASFRLVFTSARFRVVQKHRALRSSENQISRKQSSNSADGLVKTRLTRLSESQAETQHSESERPSIVIGLSFHFCFRLRQTIERFHMPSRQPYCSKERKKRRPYWCTKPFLRGLDSLLCKNHLLL